MMYYVFDGSYAGFLCCVFESFERKEFAVIPISRKEYQGDFFQERRDITTNPKKANRIIAGLRKRLGKQTTNFFHVFLSEDTQAKQASFLLMQEIFRQDVGILSNYGNAHVLYFFQTLKKINRERHRMKAFIRFKKSNEGLYYALMEPDFNVLPLIADFFQKRYADQSWLIYDVKRKYGLFYDQIKVSEVTLTQTEENAISPVSESIVLDSADKQFEFLWKQYYNSTNIASRRNIKLHLQHVPKRYWKYLPEKGII